MLEVLIKNKKSEEIVTIQNILQEQTLANLIKGFCHPLKIYIKSRDSFKECCQRALEEERILNSNRQQFLDKNNLIPSKFGNPIPNNQNYIKIPS